MSEIRVDTISERTSANGVTIDGLTIKDGAISSTAASTITVADNSDNLTLTSTDADENSGPNLRLYRNSANPAVGDNLGQIDFEGRNDNSQDVVYASMMARARDETDGNEDGGIQLDVMKDGSLTGLWKYYSDGTTSEFSINDDSIDMDFRVESNGNTHMLFVDGGNDHVNIGTSSDLGATFNVKAPNNTTTQQLVLTDNDNQTKTHIGNFSNQTYITNNTHYNGSSWVKDDNAVGTSFIGAGDGAINFGTSTDATPTNRWVIDSTGNLVPQSTSLGIYLGVTSATASNLLSDYEEGEFTYTITGSTSGSLSARSGYTKGSYVKIGNWVQVNIRYETDADNSLSGNVYWSLPFTMANPNGSDADAAVAPGYIRDDSMGTNARSGYYFLSEGNAFVYLLFSREGAANNILEVANDGDTDGVMEGCISISYRTT